MSKFTKINIKQYTVDSNIQLFLDSNKTKFKTFQSDSLREALKAGRSLIGAEKTKFENEFRSIKKRLKLDFNADKISEANFNRYIRFIGIDLLLAYNTENRFSVLITKNGTKTTRVYTAPMKAATTKINNADYFDFTFNTDRNQKSLDECSRLGILKTMSRQEKETQRYYDYCEYKEMAELKANLSKLTSDDRIEFFLNGLIAEFGSSDVIKCLSMREAKMTKHETVIVKLNAVIADVKRSYTQSKNAEAKILMNEGASIDQFKSVLPTLAEIEVIEVNDTTTIANAAPSEAPPALERSYSTIVECLHAETGTEPSIIRERLNELKEEAVYKDENGYRFYMQAFKQLMVEYINYDFNPTYFHHFTERLTDIRTKLSCNAYNYNN